MGTPICSRRLGDQGRCLEILDWVDVGGVLRPHDEVGWWQLARRHACGQLDGLVDVVVQDGLPLRVEVQPEPGDVALHDGHGRRVGCVSPDRHEGAGVGDRTGDDERYHRPPEPRSRPAGKRHHGRCQQRADERHRERDQGRPAERREPHRRQVGLGEREPTPGEAPERPPSAQGLLADPQRRDPQRPPPHPGHQRRRGPEDGEVDRLRGGKDQPGRRPHIDAAPLQQRHEEREPEHQSEPQRRRRSRSRALQASGARPRPAPARAGRTAGRRRAGRGRPRWRRRVAAARLAPLARSDRPFGEFAPADGTTCRHRVVFREFNGSGPDTLRTDCVPPAAELRAVVYWASGPLRVAPPGRGPPSSPPYRWR